METPIHTAWMPRVAAWTAALVLSLRPGAASAYDDREPSSDGCPGCYVEPAPVPPRAPPRRLLLAGGGSSSFTVFTNADYILTLHPNGRVVSMEVDPPTMDRWLAATNLSSADMRLMAQRVYNHFQDGFNFILIVNDTDSSGSGYSGIHYGVKNDTTGIGKSIYNNTALYGSTGSLQGVIHLRRKSMIRGGPSLHELAHRWENYLHDWPGDGGGHWSFSSGGGQLGGWKNGTLTNVAPGTWRANGPSDSGGFGTVANGGNGVPYSDIEMYLAGFENSAAVSNLVVASNAAFTGLFPGEFTASAISTVTVAQIIATEGPRAPAYGPAPTNFTPLFLVLTSGPMTTSRWDQFDGDIDLFTLPASDGSSLYNFWEATAGRARLQGDGLHALVRTNQDAYLVLVPGTEYVATSHIGQAVSPSETVYTLTNPSPSVIAWQALWTQNWLSVSPPSGFLPASQAAAVTVSVAGAAAELPVGAYPGRVLFANVSNGVSAALLTRFTMNGPASMPFEEGFESGAAAGYWDMSGTFQHAEDVTQSWTPYAGSWQLVLYDSVSDVTWSRNEATLTINLAGWSNVVLRFWVKGFSDDPHPPPASSNFTGGADFDGVAICPAAASNTWYVIQDLAPLSNTYTQYLVNLDMMIARFGVSYGPTFRIRWNHYDNSPINADGMAVDDISITGDPPPPPVISGAEPSSGTNGTSFALSGIAGVVYQWQAATNLVEPEWLDMGSRVYTTNADSMMNDPDPSGPQKFYRVLISP